VGVAFVTFKCKDCVSETIDELDIVKTKLVGKEHYDALDIKNWEVDSAMPSNDIIWHEINKGKSRSLIVRILISLIPFLISVAFIGGIYIADYKTDT
jgi:hypothetical protein